MLSVERQQTIVDSIASDQHVHIQLPTTEAECQQIRKPVGGAVGDEKQDGFMAL